MKHKRVAMLSMMIVGVFLLSSIGTVTLYSNTHAQSVTNFEIVVETNTGNRRREAYALYLKQALAPLGIEVTVIGKPFNQFVGDLLHFTSFQWDIAIVGFSGGSPLAPAFVDLYACDGGFFGVFTYQLCEDAWNESLVQTSTAQGNTLTQAMVDDMLWSMELEFNMTKRMEMTNTFQQWFMEQLLYDYPLLAPTGLVGIWAGLDGYDANEGVFGSIFSGSDWDYANYPQTASGRKNDADTISFSIGSIDPNFDPLQVTSVPQSWAVDNIFPTLVMFDKSYVQHPNVALTYNISTWENAPLLNETECVPRDCEIIKDGETPVFNQTVDFGHIQYTLRDDVYWVNTTGGATQTTEKVKPSDFAFTFQLYMSDHLSINGQSSYANVYDVQANDTANTLDIWVYHPNIDDVFFGSTSVVPAHLLNQTLTYDFDNGTIVNAAPLSDEAIKLFEEDGVSPFDTDEWDAFETNPLQAGAYYVDFTDSDMYTPGTFVKKEANPFFWFPNEEDSPGQDFLLNVPGQENTYYFDYNGGNDVTELTITKVDFPIIEDLATDLLLFKDGSIDLNSPDFFGGAEIETQRNDERFEVHSFETTSTADLLMFNVLHPDLTKYNVRRAIAHAIDKDALSAIVDNLREPQDSPVKRFFIDWYKDDWKIPHDLDKAKELLEGEGYPIPDLNQEEDFTTQGAFASLLASLGSEMFVFLSAFATVFTALVVRRRRKI